MNAIVVKEGKIQIIDTETPAIGEDEVLVKVAYSGINRADLAQVKGIYPPPPGVTAILGLEFSGRIEAIGHKVSYWKIGDAVTSIVAGGGYASYLKVKANHLLPIPQNISLAEAGGMSEAFITAFQALEDIGKIKENENILIHAGASGVGTAAIQIAKSIGANVVCTASAPKHEYCYSLGADHCIDYKNNPWQESYATLNRKGADFILDFIGADYFQDNLKALATDGRMVMLGFLGGVKIQELNIGSVLMKRLLIQGSTLRSRSDHYKAELIKNFKDTYLKDNTFPFKVHIDKIFHLDQVEAAHKFMAGNKNKGKILLEWPS
jgi:putative PIG3 family NAD(P)H quinone oxidoreductase